MKEAWSIAMLISGALFIAGVFPITWERAPAWRAADRATFRTELAYTLRRVDRLQPALLVACLVSSTGFAVAASGTTRILAAAAAACILAILVGSGVRQVPIQRRLTDARSDLTAADVDRLRTGWLAGNLVRTIAAIAAFALLAIAVSV